MEQAVRQDMSDGAVPRRTSLRVAKGRTNETPRSTDSKAILVVDDEPEVAMVVMEVFRQEGYRVDIAGNGEEALVKLQQRPYDAIICDFRMPKMNGLTFYHTMARQFPGQVGQVLFMTVDVLNPDIQEFLEQVPAPVLNKPFTIQALCEAVWRILQNGETP